MRGPGSLNNSGKLFMEHALFIHRLGVSEALGVDGGAAALRGPRREEGSTEKGGRGGGSNGDLSGVGCGGGKKTKKEKKKKNITLPTVQ